MKFLLQIAVVSVALWAAGAAGAASNESGRVALTRLSLGEIVGWLELSIDRSER